MTASKAESDSDSLSDVSAEEAEVEESGDEEEQDVGGEGEVGEHEEESGDDTAAEDGDDCEEKGVGEEEGVVGVEDQGLREKIEEDGGDGEQENDGNIDGEHDNEEQINKESEEHCKVVPDFSEDLNYKNTQKHALSSEQVRNPESLVVDGNAEGQSQYGVSGISENSAPLLTHESELAQNNLGNDPGKKSDSVMGKEESDLQDSEKYGPQNDLCLRSMSTPQRRPRSPSPSATIENANKRSAAVCDFFLRGWCIKGSSCKFLHQKDEVLTASQGKKDLLSGSSSKRDYTIDSVPRHEAESLKASHSDDPLGSLDVESPPNSQLRLQRELVRAYGSDTHEPQLIHDTHGPHRPLNVGGSFFSDEYDHPSRNPSHEKFGSRFDFIDGRYSTREDLLSTKHMGERSFNHELLERGTANDTPFYRSSAVSRDAIFLEQRYHLPDSTSGPSIFRNRSDHMGIVRRAEGLLVQSEHNSLAHHDSKTSYGSKISMDLQYSNPLLPVDVSSVDHHHARIPHNASTVYNSDRLKTPEFEKGHFGSRYSSHQRLSSSFSLRSEMDNVMPKNAPRDLSSKQKLQIQANAWEPSMPFRSFYSTDARITSPGSQYDPLLDSIEPTNIDKIASRISFSPILDNVRNHHTHSKPILEQKHNQGFQSQYNPTFLVPHETAMVRNTPEVLNSTMTFSRFSKDDGRGSKPKDGKGWASSITADGLNMYAINPTNNQEDKIGHSKEPKSMKIFRAALVDSLKELVKPFWRDGHLSKDIHKTVVKKAAEKVLSALQPHQIPNTTELVTQFLSSSRPKLLKLVEGYVEKYSKPGVPNV